MDESAIVARAIAVDVASDHPREPSARAGPENRRRLESWVERPHDRAGDRVPALLVAAAPLDGARIAGDGRAAESLSAAHYLIASARVGVRRAEHDQSSREESVDAERE